MRDRWELRGTLFFEFQPGAYTGQHWQPGSVYVYEEFWPDLEDIVARHISEYSHSACTPVGAKAWSAILSDFDEFANALRGARVRPAAAALLPVLFRWLEPLEGAYWRRYVLQYAALVRELTLWLRVQLAENDTVSVLGI
jgi:hypothetical protein